MISAIALLALASVPFASAWYGNGTFGYQVATPPLTTNWTYILGENPWYQYPRPQMVRDRWQNLNGVWKWENASNGLDELNYPPFGKDFQEPVLVPSCLESGISGVLAEGWSVLTTWWQTNFTVPSDWGNDRVILNFDAVDQEATVFVNGQNATFHRGGYIRFSVDVTQYLNQGGNNELLVFVHDPTDAPGYVSPIGKQTLNPSHIFYTPCTGIWQSVWIEPVPQTYIAGLDVAGDMYGGVNITVYSSDGSTGSASAYVHTNDSGASLGNGNGTANSWFTFNASNPSLWSPDSPMLYNITVTMGNDTVEAYTGFRSLSVGVVNNVTRPLLNGESIFLFGTLDQGFWPDGIYTPPNVDAMRYDLQVLKEVGFNMLRKHIKVEPDLYYRATDEMGLLVIQDMPAMNPNGPLPNSTQQDEFQSQLFELVRTHRSFTSICTWIIYNEGWGQLPSAPELYLTPIVRSLDPTRLIDSVTGWHQHGAGDFLDNHHYSSPQCGSPFYSIDSSPYDPTKIGFQGEFGGIGNNVSIEHATVPLWTEGDKRGAKRSLWDVEEAILTINQTYELDADLETWNWRAHNILYELQQQVDRYACSGGVWTQTTDVEGEVNGLMTYDRRVLRTYVDQWNDDINALYSASEARRTQGPMLNYSASTPGAKRDLAQMNVEELIRDLPPNMS